MRATIGRLQSPYGLYKVRYAPNTTELLRTQIYYILFDGNSQVYILYVFLSDFAPVGGITAGVYYFLAENFGRS